MYHAVHQSRAYLQKQIPAEHATADDALEMIFDVCDYRRTPHVLVSV